VGIFNFAFITAVIPIHWSVHQLT